jgi:hypothetical protein
MEDNGTKPEFERFSVDALRWYKDGDCEGVRMFDMGIIDKCPICGVLSTKHGMVDEQIVCPGDYIMKLKDGKLQVASKALFKLTFHEMNREEATIEQRRN